MGHIEHDDYVPDPNDRFEKTDANYGSVTFWTLVIFVSAVLAAPFAYFYMKNVDSRIGPDRARFSSPLVKSAQDKPTIDPNLPKLQISPSATMTAFAKQQEKDLTSYSWISREAGVVRIPVKEAMAIALKQGFSSTPEKEKSGVAPDDGSHLPQDSSAGRTYWNILR